MVKKMTNRAACKDEDRQRQRGDGQPSIGTSCEYVRGKDNEEGATMSCSFSIRAGELLREHLGQKRGGHRILDRGLHGMGRHPSPYTVLPPGDDQRAHFRV